jgi:hypothetical protein
MRFLDRECGNVDAQQIAVQADHRRLARRDVQVGGALFGHELE